MGNRSRSLLASLAAGLFAVGAGAQEMPSQPMPIAVLQGLDKITARIYTFEAPIDRTIGFGTLKVSAKVCRKRPPEYPPESAAYLEVVEEKPGDVPRQIFSGWMFASSPALNPLEHPVYDVWVVDCRTTSIEGSGGRR